MPNSLNILSIRGMNSVTCSARKSHGFRFILRTFVLAAMFASCATFHSPTYDVSDLRVEQKKNGYLVDLVAHRQIGDVAAFVTRDNWLIITMVDATVDFDRLRAIEPNDLISTCQVVGSKTSVQLTLKLKKEFRSCEVVRGPSITDVSVALFSQ